MTDKFVDKFFTKEGESVEDAKKRMAEKQSELEANRKEMINKSLEVSKNAGKIN